jgi:hypothetical protein
MEPKSTPLTELSKAIRLRGAGWLWVIALAVVTVMVLYGPWRTVVPEYRDAALAWMRGAGLYDTDGHGFLYLPASAVLFLPLGLLPATASELVWRYVVAGCYVAGMWRLGRVVARDRAQAAFAFAPIVSLPIAWPFRRLDQATLAMAGMMMLAAADMAERRWSRAALWLSLGMAIKPLTIVQTLLAGALYRPLRWRAALGVLAVLAFPFACQHPAYVAGEYQAFAAMLRSAAELGEEPTWAQIFTVPELLLGVDVASGMRTIVRLAAALGTLCLAWRARRTLTPEMGAFLLFLLAACYLMLFNPRTENNTYALLAPALAICLDRWGGTQRRTWLAAFTVVVAVAILGSYELGKLLQPRVLGVWLAPLATAAFFLVVALLLVTRRFDRARGSVSLATTPTRRFDRPRSPTTPRRGVGEQLAVPRGK